MKPNTLDISPRPRRGPGECGVPAVASRIGALAEIVKDGTTGALFRPGDAADLAEKCRSLWHDPDMALRMGTNAQAEFERAYSPDENIASLLDIYSRVLRNRFERRS